MKRRAIATTLVVALTASALAHAVDGNISGSAELSGLATASRVRCEAADEPTPPPTPEPGLRRFTDDEFQRLVDLIGRPAVAPRNGVPSILGDSAADDRIRAIAETRGYRPRSDTSPADLVFVDGRQLSRPAASAWREMVADARRSGVTLTLASAYRSHGRQRQIFVGKLSSAGFGVTSVRAGRADSAINVILRFSSIPGYSRHHTGVTVDVLSPGFGFLSFDRSNAYGWLSVDNFAAAKRHGFVPSYPATAGDQGPDPEPWEFVYVGADVLEESDDRAWIASFDVEDGRARIAGVPITYYIQPIRS